jgi:hypothetical protein
MGKPTAAARGEGMCVGCPCLVSLGERERERRGKQGGGAAGEVLCGMCVAFLLSLEASVGFWIRLVRALRNEERRRRRAHVSALKIVHWYGRKRTCVHQPIERHMISGRRGRFLCEELVRLSLYLITSMCLLVHMYSSFELLFGIDA